MESLQKQWTAKGVVWLSILSDPPGEQGYATPAEENDYLKTMHASPTAALLDPAGAIGRLYDARTTPHMFVIDPAGKIVYQGALDDKPTPDPASLKGADNNVSDASTAAMRVSRWRWRRPSRTGAQSTTGTRTLLYKPFGHTWGGVLPRLE
jgi:hypothetical protein